MPASMRIFIGNIPLFEEDGGSRACTGSSLCSAIDGEESGWANTTPPCWEPECARPGPWTAPLRLRSLICWELKQTGSGNARTLICMDSI
ncbi:hypothetical protein NDU88_001236 [Pleurodeles waltl]|uniref:Uncharacterized protein n=1 Tax=Pleurodeles waltl TaxID=8319 RepID=A0AAV7P618_PLEWA|nr:hypothetical protein NDU88_001236 [Pleurodeles waltl]